MVGTDALDERGGEKQISLTARHGLIDSSVDVPVEHVRTIGRQECLAIGTEGVLHVGELVFDVVQQFRLQEDDFDKLFTLRERELTGNHFWEGAGVMETVWVHTFIIIKAAVEQQHTEPRE